MNIGCKLINQWILLWVVCGCMHMHVCVCVYTLFLSVPLLHSFPHPPQVLIFRENTIKRLSLCRLVTHGPVWTQNFQVLVVSVKELKYRCTQITEWQGNFSQKQSGSTVPMLDQRAESNWLKEHSGVGSLFGALFCELSEEAELGCGGTGAWKYGFLFPLTDLMM